jgi:hypothetical protein
MIIHNTFTWDVMYVCITFQNTQENSVITSRRVSSGFGMKSSRPSTKSIYNGGSCWTKGRSCLTRGGLRFSSCLMASSACYAWILISLPAILGMCNMLSLFGAVSSIIFKQNRKNNSRFANQRVHNDKSAESSIPNSILVQATRL